jgi:hypothetical protein
MRWLVFYAIAGLGMGFSVASDHALIGLVWLLGWAGTSEWLDLKDREKARQEAAEAMAKAEALVKQAKEVEEKEQQRLEEAKALQARKERLMRRRVRENRSGAAQ